MRELFKTWVLNWGFVKDDIAFRVAKADKDARDEERPQVFRLAQKDILETMKDDVQKKVDEGINAKMVELLSPIDWRSVVTYSDTVRKIFVGGEMLEEGRAQNLASEANILLDSELWKLIYETAKALAEREMFIAGDSIEFMKKGRSMLYTLDCIKKTATKLSTYAQKS